MFSNPVNIGPVVISPSGATATTVTAGEPVTLECSADITPNPLPQNTPSPTFEWFIGLTNEPCLSTTTKSGSMYTSTLQIAMVGESDEGMYTCRLRGNQRTAVSTTVTVNPGELLYSLVPRPSHSHTSIYARLFLITPKSGKVWSIWWCNDNVTWTGMSRMWMILRFLAVSSTIRGIKSWNKD